MTSGNAFLCFCLSERQCFAEAVISLGWECESSLSAAPAQGENKGRSPLTRDEVFLWFLSKNSRKLNP